MNPNETEEFLKKLFNGINDACEQYRVPSSSSSHSASSASASRLGPSGRFSLRRMTYHGSEGQYRANMVHQYAQMRTPQEMLLLLSRIFNDPAGGWDPQRSFKAVLLETLRDQFGEELELGSASFPLDLSGAKVLLDKLYEKFRVRVPQQIHSSQPLPIQVSMKDAIKQLKKKGFTEEALKALERHFLLNKEIVQKLENYANGEIINRFCQAIVNPALNDILNYEILVLFMRRIETPSMARRRGAPILINADGARKTISDMDNDLIIFLSELQKNNHLSRGVLEALFDSPEDVQSVSESIGILTQRSLSDPANIARFREAVGKSEYVAELINYLDSNSLLNQDSFNKVCQHPGSAKRLYKSIKRIKDSQIDDKEKYIQKILKDEFNRDISEDIICLHKVNLLNDENIKKLDVFPRSERENLHQFIIKLGEKGSINLFNQNAFLKCCHLTAESIPLSHLFNTINTFTSLSQAQFDFLLNKFKFTLAVRYINECMNKSIGIKNGKPVILNNQENRDKLFACFQSEDLFTHLREYRIAPVDKLAEAMQVLERKGLLTQDSFDFLLENAGNMMLMWTIISMENYELFNLKNIEQSRGNFEMLQLLSASNHIDDVFLNCLRELASNKCLTQENFEYLCRQAIQGHPIADITFAMKWLSQQELLDVENKTILEKYPAYARGLADAFCCLKVEGLNSRQNKMLVCEQPEYAAHLAAAMKKLKMANLCTDKNIARLAQYRAHAENLAKAMITLHQAELLDDSHFSILCEHIEHAKGIAKAIFCLKQANLLTKNIHFLKVNPQRAKWLSEILDPLAKANLVTQANLNTIFGFAHDHKSIINVMAYLDDEDMLTQANFDSLCANVETLKGVAKVVFLLGDRLNQPRFEQLMAYARVFEHDEIIRALYRIPPHLYLNIEENFERWIAACANNAPIVGARQAIIRDITELMGPRNVRFAGRVQARAGINAGQSTHTASVHRSVSESAKKLHQRYKKEDINQALEELKAWLNEQEATTEPANKIRAAQAALERILERREFSEYVDPDSKVSIETLLAYTWIGMHRPGDWKETETALKEEFNSIERKAPQAIYDLLLEGLYQVQREYNIDADEIDNGQMPDRPSCTSGTFNKIMETLKTIHADVTIIFQNKTSASEYLQNITKQIAKEYLVKLAKSTEPADIERYQKIKEEDFSISEFWGEIKLRVHESVTNNFDQLFTAPAQVDEFIMPGEYVELSAETKEDIEKASQANQEQSASVRDALNGPQEGVTPPRSMGGPVR